MPFLYLLKNIPNYNLELIISIIIPAYNSEATIEKCVHSLTSQSFPRNQFEIIVVDDCSTDKTADLAKSAGANHVISTEKNSGQGVARNLGAKHAKGKFLAFIDSDCEAKKGWIKTIAEELQTQKAIGGPVLNGNPQSLVAWAEYFIEFSAYHEHNKKSVLKYMLPGCNLACTKEVFEKTGGFTDVRLSEDVWFGECLKRNGIEEVFVPNLQILHLCRTKLKTIKSNQKFRGKCYVRDRKIDSSLPHSSLKESKWLVLMAFFGRSIGGLYFSITGRKFSKFIFSLPYFLIATIAFCSGVSEAIDEPTKQE